VRRSNADVRAQRMKDPFPVYNEKCIGCREKSKKIQDICYGVEDASFEIEDAAEVLKTLNSRQNGFDDRLTADEIQQDIIDKRLVNAESKLKDVETLTRRMDETEKGLLPALVLVARYDRVKVIAAFVIVVVSTLTALLMQVPSSWWGKVFRI